MRTLTGSGTGARASRRSIQRRTRCSRGLTSRVPMRLRCPRGQCESCHLRKGSFLWPVLTTPLASQSSSRCNTPTGQGSLFSSPRCPRCGDKIFVKCWTSSDERSCFTVYYCSDNTCEFVITELTGPGPLLLDPPLTYPNVYGEFEPTKYRRDASRASGQPSAVDKSQTSFFEGSENP